MKYFADCLTIEDVKKEFKRLAFLHHPDKGGSTATMQEINKAYKFAIASVLSGSGKTDQEINDSILESEAYSKAVESIIHLDGLIIELVGVWIWVTGNTRQHKDVLKSSGFFYASKKQAWYFRTAEHEHKRKNGKVLELDTIRTKYGSQTINKGYRPALSS